MRTGKSGLTPTKSPPRMDSLHIAAVTRAILIEEALTLP